MLYHIHYMDVDVDVDVDAERPCNEDHSTIWSILGPLLETPMYYTV